MNDSLERKILLLSFLAAAAVELVLLLLGLSPLNAPSHHIPPPVFLEAEIYEAPKVDKLLSEKPVAAAPKEAVISKTPDKGRAAKPGENIVDTNNRTETGTALPPSHGPIVVYSPQPSIPQYMRDQALKASVVIDFTITATGEASPRLVNSSGNEELDAIALKTAKTWRFKAAAKENHPVDSKIRLRIVFEVN